MMANDLPRCITFDAIDIGECGDMLARLHYTEGDPAPAWAASMWCQAREALGYRPAPTSLASWAGWTYKRAISYIRRRRALRRRKRGAK